MKRKGGWEAPRPADSLGRKTHEVAQLLEIIFVSKVGILVEPFGEARSSAATPVSSTPLQRPARERIALRRSRSVHAQLERQGQKVTGVQNSSLNGQFDGWRLVTHDAGPAFRVLFERSYCADGTGAEAANPY